MNTQTYQVTGMTCGGCVRHVDKAIRNTPGVTDVVVDLASGTAKVTGTAAFETLAAQVAEAGYHLAELA
ncbi:heavy-metal-associated domain-containing protein [Geothrix campi]|jgi:copper chaperone CopZ|uniref:heavy-metal-associated domain-containing protein n=1 Tax=Geothrix campi TaxID=2966450 RepID=UPI0021482B3D|nr:heavy metal-associated domain-containing protein [Geothrix sp. SG10]